MMDCTSVPDDCQASVKKDLAKHHEEYVKADRSRSEAWRVLRKAAALLQRAHQRIEGAGEF